MTAPPTKEQVLKAIETLYPGTAAVAKLMRIPHSRLYVQGGLLRDLASSRAPKEADIMIIAPGTIAERESAVENALQKGGFTKLGSVRNSDGTNYHYLPPSSSSLESGIDINVHGLEYLQQPRGDFTVNSVYMDLESGELFDALDGLSDLDTKILRAVDDPRRAFAREPFLVFRAIKLICQLGLVPEPDTKKALYDAVPRTRETLAYVAQHKHTLLGEWMLDNIFRGLKYDSARYVSLLEELGMLSVFTKFLSKNLSYPSSEKRNLINPFVMNRANHSYEENLSLFFSALARCLSKADAERTFLAMLDLWGIRDVKKYHSFGARAEELRYLPIAP